MTRTLDDCEHLTVSRVREIHAVMLEEFGGSPGFRDEGLLESAVAAPQGTSFGRSPFADLVEVAAAYLFYICRDHSFIDGNKRTAMAAAIVFFRMNGMEPAPDSEEWEKLVLDVAAFNLDRDGTTRRFKELAPGHRSP